MPSRVDTLLSRLSHLATRFDGQAAPAVGGDWWLEDVGRGAGGWKGYEEIKELSWSAVW